MATAGSVVVALKALLIALFCLMVVMIAYLFVCGDYLTCFDSHARWFLQITTDFTIYVAVLGAWYAYKESSWIIALVLMVPMYFLGSIISIGYILMQFYKLSPEESSKDPLYLVLARRQKRDRVGYTDTGRHSVVTARVIYSALGCVELGTLSYSVYVDLSPSYIKYFTPCIITNGIDIYILVVILSVWVAYKESSNWITAFFWILSIFCFRGDHYQTSAAIILPLASTTCFPYNFQQQQQQSFHFEPGTIFAPIIFHRDDVCTFIKDASDPPLMAHTNV